MINTLILEQFTAPAWSLAIALIQCMLPDLKPDRLSPSQAVGQQCAAVICCRVSPKQKALVTALVKTTGDTTLGIGDGANDVGMIQEAHIGVGISGQEGMQAVMSSDFSIAQFRYLETLLLVHGRWSYARITRMVLFFFYKNLLFGLTLFYFNCLCFFSGQTLYNDFYMSLYNVVFTALTPLIVGTMDSDVNREMSRKYPGLYQAGPRNRYFDLKAVVGWLANSAFQSAVVFVMVMGALAPQRADRHTGRTAGQWQTGATLFTAVIITNLSQGIFHLFLEVMATSATFWLLIILAPVAAVLPGYLWRQLKTHFRPDDKRVVQEISQRTQLGQLARVKSLHPNGGPLSKELMARSSFRLERPSFINSGYVPQDKPGTAGYFTPRSSALYANDCFDHADCTSRNPVMSRLNGELQSNPFRHRTARKLHTHIKAQGQDSSGKGGKSRLCPTSAQVLTHEPRSDVILFQKTLTDRIAVTADAKTSAQRRQSHNEAADDSLKAFTPTAQLPTSADSNPPFPPLQPVRTLLPAASGPLPTPHAVPHQSPPALSSWAPKASFSSSSSGAGTSEAASMTSEVSYSHVTPYMDTAAQDSSNAASTASPLIADGSREPTTSRSPDGRRR
ncbi:hypothetical protein ABBQ32_000189 [Trebouxia sp. C0010 RCD-2024]